MSSPPSMTKTNAELADEIERQLRDDGLRLPVEELSDASPHAMVYRRVQLSAPPWRQIIAALRSGPERDVEPFCWWRTTRDITDEYVTVYSDDGTRPEGDGWKPLYERPPSGEMVMVPREPDETMVQAGYRAVGGPRGIYRAMLAVCEKL